MRRLVVHIESNRVTCGSCRFLRKDIMGGSNDEWGCDLFGYEAHLGFVGAMKTPNRAPICLEAEKAGGVEPAGPVTRA